MKNKYKIIIAIFILEYVCLDIMKHLHIQIKSWIGNVVGVLLFLAPLLVFFYMLKEDKGISVKIRILAKILFWFWIISYVIGVIAKTIALNY